MPAVNVYVTKDGEISGPFHANDFEMLVDPIQFNNLSHIRAMVEAPDCDLGNVLSTEYFGTHFARVTCEIPHGTGPAQKAECKTYNPYTSNWTTVSCDGWPEPE
jgi:hypothetical protein